MSFLFAAIFEGIVICLMYRHIRYLTAMLELLKLQPESQEWPTLVFPDSMTRHFTVANVETVKLAAEHLRKTYEIAPGLIYKAPNDEIYLCNWVTINQLGPKAFRAIVQYQKLNPCCCEGNN